MFYCEFFLSPTVVPLLRLLLSQAVDEINADSSILPSSRLVVSVTKTEKDHSLEDLEAVVLDRLATGNTRKIYQLVCETYLYHSVHFGWINVLSDIIHVWSSGALICVSNACCTMLHYTALPLIVVYQLPQKHRLSHLLRPPAQ